MVRRSSRSTNPNKKYTLDPFEQYRELLESSSNDSRAPSIHEDQDEASDDEFDEANAAEELAQAEAEEGNGSEDGAAIAGGAVESSEDEALVPAVEVSDDEALLEVTPKARPPPVKSAVIQKPQTRKRGELAGYNALPIFDPMGNSGAKGRNIHYTRGIPELVHQQGREGRLLYSVGPGEEDLAANIQARDRWLNDVTLPYRKRHKDSAGGGLAYCSFYTEERRDKEAAEELDWYYDGGGQQILKQNQVCRTVEMDFAQNNHTATDSIVAGSINAQECFTGLKPMQLWNMGDAYAKASRSNEQEAWTINAGARIQSLEWCPNRNGSSQYLAISTSQSPSDTKDDIDVLAPAYTPHSRRQQCLQIWEVFAKGTDNSVGSKIDFTRRPVLRRVYSTDWGYVKKMRWCPVPDRPDSEEYHLGLLGAIFTDGKLRVLDISTDAGKKNEVEYIHIDKVAFESKPPDTLCTCVTWLSSKNIAVGTSDGSVAIWTLSDALKLSASSTSNPRPWFYQRLHQAYIQSISCGYPSRPHVLITYSFDGLLRATDLRSPSLDTVTSQRSRIAQGPVIWHDITQSALNIDDNFTLKSYGMRIFYKSVSVARLTAFASDVATSVLHPSVLVGCVDGTVWATNPMRRLRDHKHKPLVQCILKHEWRRPVKQQQKPQDEGDGNVEMLDEQEGGNPLLSKPLIRLMVGYKIQQADMGQENRANVTREYVSFATVYEEKTACTQVAWNPNLRAGTWAALGMASGLVIIKDLAAD
jgi:transcription factor C subunit 6